MSAAEFTASQAGVTMTARLHRENTDVLIELIGGDVPHYGVVTTVSGAGTQTVAMPSRPGHHHQEGVLTEAVAELIAPVLAGNAVIVGGLHVNRITAPQMHATFALARQLGGQLRDYLASHPREAIPEIFAK